MVYIRTTPYTNAVCCLLNALELLKKDFKASSDNEFSMWLSSAVLPMRTSSVYALASIGKSLGLNPKLIVDSLDFDFPDYRFHRYKKADVLLAKVSSEIYRKKCEAQNIKIDVKKVDFEIIKDLIKSNYLIVRINTKNIRSLKKNNSNYVLFKSFKDGFFDIIDPSQGLIKVEESLVLESYISLETKKHRAHKVLVLEK